jgi:hypothetical protein
MIEPEKQMELLSPSIWKEISNGFELETKVPLTLTETILLKGKKNRVITQRVLFYFICEGVRCGIGIEFPNRILNNIKKNKAYYDNVLNESKQTLIKSYNQFKDGK